MLQKQIRHLSLLDTGDSKGFSLIEAMISAAIMALGFVGVFTLIAASEQFTSRSIAKQKMQMIANQIVEVIESDLANIDSYTMNLNLAVCTPPATADRWVVRGFEWCTRLKNEIDPALANVRTISITTIVDLVTGLPTDRRLVTIFLEGRNKSALVVMLRIFYV